MLLCTKNISCFVLFCFVLFLFCFCFCVKILRSTPKNCIAIFLRIFIYFKTSSTLALVDEDSPSYALLIRQSIFPSFLFFFLIFPSLFLFLLSFHLFSFSFYLSVTFTFLSFRPFLSFSMYLFCLFFL